MATHGICATLLDSDKHIYATKALADDLDAIKPGMPIRVAIRGDAHNHIDLAAYNKALAPYRIGGRRIIGLLDLDFNRPWLEGVAARAFYPNEALGYQSNKRWNRWIKDSTKRAFDVAKGLHIDEWIVGNEQDLLGEIPMGANTPPVQGDKAPALNDKVSYSYQCEVGGWLKEAGAKSVALGALSWLPFSGDDDKNPYDGGFMREGLAYLKATGVTKYPWTAVTLNTEGVWTPAKANAMAKEVAHCLDLVNLKLPIWVGEWSWQNGHGVNAADAKMTFDALSGVAELLFFFQHLCRTPDKQTDYGLRLWRVLDGGFIPAFGPLPWHPIFAGLVRA